MSVVSAASVLFDTPASDANDKTNSVVIVGQVEVRRNLLLSWHLESWPPFCWPISSDSFQLQLHSWLYCLWSNSHDSGPFHHRSYGVALQDKRVFGRDA